MESMKKDHFAVHFDQDSEQWWVVKNKDELTKNHRDPEALIGGIMPQNKDDKLCPVRSYMLYKEHLNPENEYLWQVPLKVFNREDPVWYGKGKIGKNPLAKFMSSVSVFCGLSRVYTNHCIRVTGASVLTRMKFSSSEIMSVTGHKSVQSLAIYQKTQDKKKIEMEQVIHQSMTRSEDEITVPSRQPLRALPPPPPAQQLQLPPPAATTSAVQNKENANAAIVPFEPNLDQEEPPSFDIQQLIFTKSNKSCVLKPSVSGDIFPNTPPWGIF